MSKSKKQLKKELKMALAKQHAYSAECDELLKRLHESERRVKLDCGHLETFEEAIHAACNTLYHSVKHPQGDSGQWDSEVFKKRLTNALQSHGL